MSQDPHTTRSYLVHLSISGVLALLTLLVYFPSFNYPFVSYDDQLYVYQNQQVQAGLTADSIRWAFTTFDCGNWHPLTWLSLQLDCVHYGGLKASGFHRTNVLLHIVNTLLLFLILCRLTGAVWRSAIVAALFALHPLHVESVAWVAERKDVLSTCFWMLTLAAYSYYVRRPNVARHLLVVVTFGLGLLAKPMLVTLPCVLLLLDYWPLNRWRPGAKSASSFRHLVQEKLPLFALVLASCIVTFLAQVHGKAVAPLEAIPLAVRFGNALLAYGGYLGKMLWPLHLAVLYPHPGVSVSVAKALGAALFLVVVTVLVLDPGRRWPYLAVGWFWYLGTLVPVIGLVQVGAQAMADRYTYVPLIGVFLLLTWGLADLAIAWRLPRPYPVATTALVLAACGALTGTQVGSWKSTLHLWEHAVAVTENNFPAHVNLGQCYLERGRLSEAKREFEKAMATDPQHAEPHANLGNVLAQLDRWEQAVAEYRKAIALAPGVSWPHFNLGNALVTLGRPEEAIAEFQTVIVLDPASPWPHNNLGSVFQDLGQLEAAVTEYGQAIALDPRYAPAHLNLGMVYADLGRLEEALIEYQRALELGEQQAEVRLQACQRLRRLRPRLPGLSAGRDPPADNAERLAFAELCQLPCEGRYALAARLYGDAFSADPKLADDQGTATRFNAASAAAAAGWGQGPEAAQLDESEKARLRRQALDWLQADLAGWTRQAQSDRPQARATVQRVLRNWQRHAKLAGVRDPAALALLPETERAAWQKLWREVEAVLTRASASAKKP